MELQRASGFEDLAKSAGMRADGDYLDVSALAEGMVYTKVAYVQSVSTGLQKNAAGFITFYLKDCNANLITARLFNVEDFMLSGVKGSALAKHPVKITFVPQEFNGRMSLVIDGKIGVELYTGEFDYKRFTGSVDVDLTKAEAIGKACMPEDWELNPMYSTASFDYVGQGRAGAFASIFNSALVTVSGYCALPGVNKESLLTVFFNAMEQYFQILMNRQKLSAFGNFEDFKFINSVSVKFSSDDNCMCIVDTVKALSGASKPLGYEAALIKNAVDGAMFALNASLALQSVPFGTKTMVNGVDVLKY